MWQEDIHSAKILVVDDNPVDTELLREILRRDGFFGVDVINDPREVLEAYQAQRHDLVVLDYNMPHLDGMQVIEQLRSSNGGRIPPILMLTAQSDQSLKVAILQQGVRDFISKPIERAEVVARISNVLDTVLLHNEVIEQQKNAERREANLRAILETMVEGVIIIDEYGHIEKINGAAERLFGYELGQLVDEDVSILVPSRHRGQHGGYIAEYLSTGATHVIGRSREIVGQKKNGETFPIELAISEVILGDRRVFVGICRDISERKNAEQALQAAKSDLELRVAERTTELAYARDKALEASQLKSMFLANVSHEIRTPLNGMLGMLSLLVDSGLQADQMDYANTAYQSGEQLLSLINELLDFAKVEAGRLELESVAYDFRQVVHDATHLFAEQAATRNLDVVVLVAPDVPNQVTGDPARIRQVVSNLVGNAVKFTERGEIVVRVSVVSEKSDEISLRFEIKDTGVGIALENQQRVFDSFTQVDGSTTRRYGGTGLGLSICKQLVEVMDGTIGLESRLGAGSTFWFIVPQKKVGLSVRGHVASSFPLATRVVVVIDPEGRFLITQKHLRALAIDHEVVPLPEQLLEVLRVAAQKQCPFGVVVMDTSSLDTDGLGIVSMVKADPLVGQTKIILTAATGLRGHAREARDAGAAAYITKGISQERWREILIAVVTAAEDDHALVTRFDFADAIEHSLGVALVVEDNPVNQKVAVKILAKLGVRADVAENGKMAVSALEKAHYDVVFMDCLMPQMDGFQATRAIRAKEQERQAPSGGRVPIIAMTANASVDDRQRCLKVGMDDFVPKPITLEALRPVVERWLSGARKKNE